MSAYCVQAVRPSQSVYRLNSQPQDSLSPMTPLYPTRRVVRTTLPTRRWVTQQDRPHFRTEITSGDDGVVLIQFVGELDLVTLPDLETALDAVLSSEPCAVIFDLRRAAFISVDGFEAIGRCSLVLDRVSVRAKDAFAEKILRLLGYDRIEFITPRAARRRPVRRVGYGDFQWGLGR